MVLLGRRELSFIIPSFLDRLYLGYQVSYRLIR
jgi:hypothetical protein